jgi:hypothetical protein
LTAREQAIDENRLGDLIPEGLRFHDLRHTCTALLSPRVATWRRLKTTSGTAGSGVTSDRYGHLFPSARASFPLHEATFTH